jgi:hypothetical protein
MKRDMDLIREVLLAMEEDLCGTCFERASPKLIDNALEFIVSFSRWHAYESL